MPFSASVIERLGLWALDQVSVVNLASRPRTRHPKPRQPRGAVGSAINSNEEIAAADAPCEDPSIGVVVQELA
jgi:hypothetical protein